jgi:hypothetical protein
MAKQKKTLPARKVGDRSRDEESLLLRSAESLGRVIGSLQRHLDGATRRLSTTASEAWESIPSLPKSEKATRRGTRKRSASPKRAVAKKANGAVKNTRKTAARKKTRQR